MKIYLVRHGDYKTNINDTNGALSHKGREEITNIARSITHLNIQATDLLHSDHLRAKQTAELIAPFISLDNPLRLQPGLNPLDPIAPIAEEIDNKHGDTILVGHQPFMSKLMAQFVLGNEEKIIYVFRLGSMVCLERLEYKKWVINWVIEPALLASLK